MVVGTHDGTFHADDVLALAVLRELGLADQIIRTREEPRLSKCDMLVDVGGAYDHKLKKYDHHQIGAAGVRPNGIPYAALGLIWRHYGATMTGSQAAADILDRELIQPMDAEDVGAAGYSLENKNIELYSLGSAINRFNPQWNEPGEPDVRDSRFKDAVEFARGVLTREVAHSQAYAESESRVRAAIADAADPRLIVLEKRYPWKYTVTKEAPKALYVVYLGEKTDDWRIEVVTVNPGSYVARKPLPEAWAGKREGELAKVTGVADARFCHTARFMAAANSKEGAMALGLLALKD